jgi:hypothetical protein
MPFDFELSFTGLCAFTFSPDRLHPNEVNVLLVEPRNGHGRNGQRRNGHRRNGGAHTHAMPEVSDAMPHGDHDHAGCQNGGTDHHPRHFPLLTYRLQDLTSRSNREHRLFPGPDGQLVAWRRLKGKKLRLHAPQANGGTHPLTAVWRSTEPFVQNLPRIPRSAAEEEFLDWGLTLSMLDCGLVPDTHNRFGGLQDDQAVATITLTAGRLGCAQVVRGFNGEYTIFDLKESTGQFDAAMSQAIAETIVLRLEGLEAPVKISGFGGPVDFVEFAPTGPQGPPGQKTSIQASITNLPDREIVMSPKHVSAYLDLVSRPSTVGLKVPKVSGFLDTPGSALCPPTLNR